jgi:hypothetical protein
METGTAVGLFLIALGLGLILFGLALATQMPHSLEDIVIVAKGWVDGAIFIGVGTTVFLGGIAMLKGTKG